MQFGVVRLDRQNVMGTTDCGALMVSTPYGSSSGWLMNPVGGSHVCMQGICLSSFLHYEIRSMLFRFREPKVHGIIVAFFWCLAACVQGNAWFTFSSVNPDIVLSLIPNLSVYQLRLLLAWGAAPALIGAIPATFVVERYGYAFAYYVTVACTVPMGLICAIIAFSEAARQSATTVFFLHIAALFNGCGISFILGACAALAVAWFPTNRRGVVISAVVTSNNASALVLYIAALTNVTDRDPETFLRLVHLVWLLVSLIVLGVLFVPTHRNPLVLFHASFGAVSSSQSDTHDEFAVETAVGSSAPYLRGASATASVSRVKAAVDRDAGAPKGAAAALASGSPTSRDAGEHAGAAHAATPAAHHARAYDAPGAVGVGLSLGVAVATVAAAGQVGHAVPRGCATGAPREGTRGGWADAAATDPRGTARAEAVRPLLGGVRISGPPPPGPPAAAAADAVAGGVGDTAACEMVRSHSSKVIFVPPPMARAARLDRDATAHVSKGCDAQHFPPSSAPTAAFAPPLSALQSSVRVDSAYNAAGPGRLSAPTAVAGHGKSIWAVGVEVVAMIQHALMNPQVVLVIVSGCAAGACLGIWTSSTTMIFSQGDALLHCAFSNDDNVMIGLVALTASVFSGFVTGALMATFTTSYKVMFVSYLVAAFAATATLVVVVERPACPAALAAFCFSPPVCNRTIVLICAIIIGIVNGANGPLCCEMAVELVYPEGEYIGSELFTWVYNIFGFIFLFVPAGNGLLSLNVRSFCGVTIAVGMAAMLRMSYRRRDASARAALMMDGVAMECDEALL